MYLDLSLNLGVICIAPSPHEFVKIDHSSWPSPHEFIKMDHSSWPLSKIGRFSGILVKTDRSNGVHHCQTTTPAVLVAVRGCLLVVVHTPSASRSASTSCSSLPGQACACRYGAWTVVTTATNGIGYVVAFCLAASRLGFVLVNCNQEKLAIITTDAVEAVV